MRRRIHAWGCFNGKPVVCRHMTRRIHACHMRRRIHAWGCFNGKPVVCCPAFPCGVPAPV